MANRYCEYCGQELNENSRFCPNCGRPTHETAHVPTPEADVPVPPPPQQGWQTATPPPRQDDVPPQRRSTAIKLAIGAALAFVVLMFLGAVVVAVGGAGSERRLSLPSVSAPQSASEVLQRLKDEDMLIGESVAYTAKNDPNELLGRPNQYSSKVIFEDTRLKPDPIADKFDVLNGGSIEVFENQDDATTRKEYLKNVQKGMPMFSEYSYREGTVLLRLSHRLTPKQAAEYEDALKNIL